METCSEHLQTDQIGSDACLPSPGVTAATPLPPPVKPIPAKDSHRSQLEDIPDIVDVERMQKLQAAILAMYELQEQRCNPVNARFAVYIASSLTNYDAHQYQQVFEREAEALEFITFIMMVMLTLPNVGVAKVWAEEMFDKFDDPVPKEKRTAIGLVRGNARRIPKDGLIADERHCQFYVPGAKWDVLPLMYDETDDSLAAAYEKRVRAAMHKAGTIGIETEPPKPATDVDELAKAVAAGGIAPDSVPLESCLKGLAENVRRANFGVRFEPTPSSSSQLFTAEDV